MDSPNSSPSPQLLAANRRLKALQAQARLSTAEAEPPAGQTRQVESGLPWNETAAKDPAALPKHLGWGSEALTAVLCHRRQETDDVEGSQDWLAGLSEHLQTEPEKQVGSASLTVDDKLGSSGDKWQQVPDVPQKTQKTEDWMKLYPDMGLAMLRTGDTAVGRIWLLLRYLDTDGRGWVTVKAARAALAKKGSPLKVVGWRRLRQILQAGQGVFWQRDKERIWLRGMGAVCTTLGVAKLRLRPVAVPLDGLLDGIARFNAHCYGSFHSGRKHAMPISRQTLEELTGLSARQQRSYEKLIGIKVERNIAVGEAYNTTNIQKRAWTQGTAVFDFIDHHGKQGPAKKHYIAWHLPNSYQGCHDRAPEGRRRKINRRIDLVKKQARGNGRWRIFHQDGSAAGKAYGRDSGRKDAYWVNGKTDVRRQRNRNLWYVLEGCG